MSAPQEVMAMRVLRLLAVVARKSAQLREHLGASRNTLANTLKKLEHRGMIYATECGMRGGAKIMEYTITDAGRRHLTGIDKPVVDRQRPAGEITPAPYRRNYRWGDYLGE